MLPKETSTDQTLSTAIAPIAAAGRDSRVRAGAGEGLPLLLAQSHDANTRKALLRENLASVVKRREKKRLLKFISLTSACCACA